MWKRYKIRQTYPYIESDIRYQINTQTIWLIYRQGTLSLFLKILNKNQYISIQALVSTKRNYFIYYIFQYVWSWANTIENILFKIKVLKLKKIWQLYFAGKDQQVKESGSYSDQWL